MTSTSGKRRIKVWNSFIFILEVTYLLNVKHCSCINQR